MKIRTFEFTADAIGRADFRLASEAIRGRDPQKCTGQERQWIAQLQRALEAISDPVGDLPDEAEIDVRQRKLKASGGTIEITQKAHEKMETYIEEAPFHPAFVMAAEEFRDRWGQASKGDRDEQPKGKAGLRAVDREESA